MNRSEMEDRLIEFAVRCAALYTRIKASYLGTNYGTQLIRSSSSIGANYAEATHGRSDADFIAKIKIAEGEAEESRHWIRMIARTGLVQEKQVAVLHEACQLVAILHATAETCRCNNKRRSPGNGKS